MSQVAAIEPSGPEPTAPAIRHRRNRRGEGARLGDEIIEAALAIIDRTGSDDAVTLRAVAREVGIAAPSIYAHFADRDAIVLAAVSRTFSELYEAIVAGIAGSSDDPVERLVGGCTGYVEFGMEHPARYSVLFPCERLGAEHVPDVGPGGNPVPEGYGADSFGLLIDSIADCSAAGRSSSTAPLIDATAVWVAMHGTVTIWSALPDFPWPERSAFIANFVRALAHITP